MTSSMSRVPAFLASAAAFALAGFLSAPASAEGTVNIYTYRQPDLIKPVLDEFTKETGIRTQVLFLDKGLEERIAALNAVLD
jgi:iron(III) transport system substrate-binding protein